MIPNASAADASGWTVNAPTTTFFIGDWMNVSVSGPRTMFVGFLHFNLTDPNGTIVDEWYNPVVNGTANFSYLLPLSAPPGNYLLNASTLDELVVQVGFVVVYDEMNFMSKRIDLLERRNAELSARLEGQRLRTRELQQQVEGFWWLAPVAAFVFFYIGAAHKMAISPTWQFWTNLGHTVAPKTGLASRIRLSISDYYSPSERAAHEPSLRLVSADPKAVARVAERSRSFPLSPRRPAKIRAGTRFLRGWGL